MPAVARDPPLARPNGAFFPPKKVGLVTRPGRGSAAPAAVEIIGICLLADDSLTKTRHGGLSHRPEPLRTRFR